MAEIHLDIRGDPELTLESDGVEGSGPHDYEKLANLPSLNGVVLKGDLALEDVGITAESMGITAESLSVGSAVSEALAQAEMTDEQLEELLAEDD